MSKPSVLVGRGHHGNRFVLGHLVNCDPAHGSAISLFNRLIEFDQDDTAPIEPTGHAHQASHQYSIVGYHTLTRRALLSTQGGSIQEG